MHDAVRLDFRVERVDAAHVDAARRVLRDVAVRAGPEMDLYTIARDDAPHPGIDVDLGEAQTLAVEIDGARNIGGCEDRRRVRQGGTGWRHDGRSPPDSTTGVAFCEETKITASARATTSCSSPGEVNR